MIWRVRFRRVALLAFGLAKEIDPEDKISRVEWPKMAATSESERAREMTNGDIKT